MSEVWTLGRWMVVPVSGPRVFWPRLLWVLAEASGGPLVVSESFGY